MSFEILFIGHHNLTIMDDEHAIRKQAIKLHLNGISLKCLS
jgi:hypothetical protein